MNIENIYIFGIGAAGANIFLNLLYAYPTINYTLIDCDAVENRNIEPGTQPYSKIDINRPKTQALQRLAFTLKNKKVDILNSRITSAKQIKYLVKNPSKSVLVDAFDNAESRNLFVGLNGFNTLHIGFSAALTGESVWDGVFTPMAASKADADIDVCEMAIARPFIMALTSMAVINISRFVESGEKHNMYFDKYLNVKRF